MTAKFVLAIIAIAVAIAAAGTVLIVPRPEKQQPDLNLLQNLAYGGPEIPLEYASLSIVKTDGFTDGGKLIAPLKNDTQNSYVIPPVYDVVLKPGGSAISR